jgi:chromosome segregation ATPase
LRRLQHAIQQVEQEKGQLEQEKSDLGIKLKAQETRAVGIQTNLAGYERKSRTLALELAKARSQNNDLEVRLKLAEGRQLQTENALQKTRDELAARQQETQQQQKAALVKKMTLGNSLEQAQKQIAASLDKNKNLYQFGRELIARFEKQGVGGILQAEPFTQIKRVELENIFQDTRDRLDENRWDARTLGAGNIP